MANIYGRVNGTDEKPKHILFSTFAALVLMLACYVHSQRKSERTSESKNHRQARYELCINDDSNRTESNVLLCTITIKGVLLHSSYSTLFACRLLSPPPPPKIVVFFFFLFFIVFFLALGSHGGGGGGKNLRRKLDESCHRTWKMGCFVLVAC